MDDPLFEGAVQLTTAPPSAGLPVTEDGWSGTVEGVIEVEADEEIDVPSVFVAVYENV